MLIFHPSFHFIVKFFDCFEFKDTDAICRVGYAKPKIILTLTIYAGRIDKLYNVLEVRVRSCLHDLVF